MPYVDYNLSLYRTGFRPYGMTDPFAAAQLDNGYPIAPAPMAGYLGTGVQPFTPGGGQRPRTHLLSGMGQARAFSPYQLSGLGRLGQGAAVCLDQNENTISCLDPNCTYGDCGSTSAQVTVGALCLDEHENQIACTDPLCTFGDCVGAGALKKATTPGVALPPGPSPRTYAPMTLFPQTAPVTSYTTAMGPTLTSSLLPIAAVLLLGVMLLGKK